MIRWLVEHGEPGCEKLLDQIEDLMVVSKCNCGCPTVYFALEGKPTSRKGERIVSDYLALVGGEHFGVMLFELDGQISSLEVYSCAGRSDPFGFPGIQTLFPYEDLSKHPSGSPPFET